jgi:SAM-dependent methyltransferase
MNETTRGYKNTWIGQQTQAEKGSFYNHYIASHLLPHIGKNVLDIGMGIGNVTEELISKVESYTGVDEAAEHMQVAHRRFKKYPFKGYAISVENPESLKMLNHDDVDTIISVNCFEHIEDDVKVMSLLCDWARPGTRFAFLVPAHQLLYGALDIQGEHFRRYSKKLMKEKLNRAGFSMEGMRYINFIGAIAWFLIGKSAKNKKQHVGHQRMSPAWKIMYILLPLAKYPLMLQRKLENIIPMPVGLSLVAWGRKRNSNDYQMDEA